MARVALLLPELPQRPSACTVLLDDELPARAFPARTGFRRRPAGDDVWYEWAKHGRTVHVRFPGVARFALSEDGTRIVCGPVDGLTTEVLQRILVSSVLPWAWSLQGEAVVHAGAVVLPEGAVAFAAPSGRGKSTLTAAFGRKGVPILTDDALFMKEPDPSGEELLAFPGHPALRLLPDSFSHVVAESDRTGLGGKGRARRELDRKNEIHLGPASFPFAGEPAPLRTVYFLARGDSDARIEITPLSARESYLELVQSAFHLDLKDEQEHRRHFDRFARIARRLPARRLGYPSDLARLGEVTRALREDVNRRGAEDAETRREERRE